MKVKIVFLIIVFLQFGMLFSKELTYQEAKDILLKNNLELKQAESKVIQARYKKLEMLTPWMPKLSTSFRYTLLSRPQLDLSSLPPQMRPLFGSSFPPTLTSDKLYVANLSISEILPLDKFVYSYNIASAQYEISKKEYEKVKRDVLIKFKESFLRTLLAKKSLEVIEKAVQISSENYKVAESLYKEGRVSYLDFSSAKINFLNSRLNLFKMQNSYKLAKENLKTILCVDYEVEVVGELEDFLVDETGSLLNKDFNCEELKKNIVFLPEMKTIELQKKILKNNLNMVRSEVFPSIVISGSYDWTVDDYKKPINEWDDRYSWNVILNWPLFNGGATFSRYKQTKESIKQVELAKQQAEDGFSLELTSLYSTYLQLKDSLSIAQEMVEQAKENYEVAKNYYLEGRTSYLELLQAELNFSNTKINYYQTLCDYIITCEKLKKYLR